MNTLKVQLVEENPSFATQLEKHLRHLGYQVLPSISKVDDAVRSIRRSTPDLVLLHARLKDQGTELERKLKASGLGIPFVFWGTVNRERTSSQDVRKVIGEKDLQKAIEKALLQKGKSPLIDRMMDQWQRRQLIRRYLFVRHGGALIKLNTRDLIYVEADGNYCYLYTSQRKFAVKISLRRLRDKLDESLFIQVNRNCLANFLKVNEVDLTGNMLQVGEVSLRIGGAYRKEVEAWLNKI